MNKKKKRHILVAAFSILGTLISLEYLGLIYPSLRSRFFYFLARLSRWFSSRTTLEEQRNAVNRLRKVIIRESSKLPIAQVFLDELLLEWVLPEQEANHDNVILYLHGGAYVQRTPEFHKIYAKSVADETSTRLLLVDYRLAPENPFPAALDDAHTAYQWLLDQGYHAENIAFAGDSAGGGLAAATVIQSRQRNMPLPACVVMMSPWLDLAGTGNSITRLASEDAQLNWDNLKKSAKSYYGDYSPKDPLVSPLYADLEGFPPSMIIAGGQEILLDDSIRFADRAQMKGVEVELIVEPNMGHVWSIFEMVIPEAQAANTLACNFFMKHLNKVNQS